MGNTATPEALTLRWAEMCRDPALQDLPYKLPRGVTLTECSILTSIGIRVPDVVWASADFMTNYGEITPYTRAPEICVEIVSSTEEKTRAYLEAGAEEVWLVSEEGAIRYIGRGGEKPKSDFPLTVSLPAPMKGNP